MKRPTKTESMIWGAWLGGLTIVNFACIMKGTAYPITWFALILCGGMTIFHTLNVLRSGAR